MIAAGDNNLSQCLSAIVPQSAQDDVSRALRTCNELVTRIANYCDASGAQNCRASFVESVPDTYNSALPVYSRRGANISATDHALLKEANKSGTINGTRIFSPEGTIVPVPGAPAPGAATPGAATSPAGAPPPAAAASGAAVVGTESEARVEVKGANSWEFSITGMFGAGGASLRDNSPRLGSAVSSSDPNCTEMGICPGGSGETPISDTSWLWNAMISFTARSKRIGLGFGGRGYLRFGNLVTTNPQDPGLSYVVRPANVWNTSLGLVPMLSYGFGFKDGASAYVGGGPAFEWSWFSLKGGDFQNIKVPTGVLHGEEFNYNAFQYGGALAGGYRLPGARSISFDGMIQVMTPISDNSFKAREPANEGGLIQRTGVGTQYMILGGVSYNF